MAVEEQEEQLQIMEGKRDGRGAVMGVFCSGRSRGRVTRWRRVSVSYPGSTENKVGTEGKRTWQWSEKRVASTEGKEDRGEEAERGYRDDDEVVVEVKKIVLQGKTRAG